MKNQIILQDRRIRYCGREVSSLLKTSIDTLLNADFISLWKASPNISSLANQLKEGTPFKMEMTLSTYFIPNRLDVTIEKQEKGETCLVEITIHPEDEQAKQSTVASDKLKLELSLSKKYLPIINQFSEGVAVLSISTDENYKMDKYRFLLTNTAFDRFIKLDTPKFGFWYNVSENYLPKYWLKEIQNFYDTKNEIENQYFDSQNNRYFQYKITKTPNNFVAIIITNITPSTLAEQKAGQSEQKFIALAEQNPSYILQFDKKLNITYSNQQANIFLSKLKQQDTTSEITTAKQISPLLVTKLKESKQINHNVDFLENSTLLASKLSLQWFVIPEKTKSGEIASYFTYANNITSQVLKEEELKTAAFKAQESDKLKTAFLANMSHEIRTPLNGMIGFAQLLKFNKSDKDFNYYVDTIEDNGHRLLAIIDDILDLSKIESGRINMMKSPFDARMMIGNLYKLFQIKMDSTNSKVDFILQTPDHAPPCILFSDEGRIRQVIANLIENAIKFTKSGQIVLGYALPDPKTIRFFVSDTGMGIKKEDQALIFDRFRQAHPNHLNPYGGNGLGLSISKKYVNMLNGEIWLHSKIRKGTTFYVTFPLTTIEECKIERENTAKKNLIVDWRDKNILIVEDDPDAMFIISRHLDDTNVNIVHAENGKIAMKKFQSEEIDLILMDIRLPDMDGYEVTEWIRNQGAELPIIFQTANVLDHDLKKSLNIGGNEFLSKPYSADKLIETMNKYLG